MTTGAAFIDSRGRVAIASERAWTSTGRDYRRKPEAWFRSREGLVVAKNILSWQAIRGDWPKNTDTMTTITRCHALL